MTLTQFRWLDTWFGAHQKIDRVARKHLLELLGDPQADFPTGSEIIRFEGLDGPDGMKRKTPGSNELWHYYDPDQPKDDRILEIITDHHNLLVKALREHNRTRAAFEASWLAHAIVDGLTPAHHYPYEKELAILRGGKGLETRTSAKEKIIMPGETVPKRVKNNWKMWGDKGLLATHFAFEWGIAVMATPLRLNRSRPSVAEVKELERGGTIQLFLSRVNEIASWKMYDQFYRSGWTPKLAKQARNELLPIIINAVTLAWYDAVMKSQQPVSKTKKKAA